MDDLTPWMRQYYELKEQCPDAILFFRMWDFYEMFWDDANIAHKVLWISITSRNKNASKPIPLAWIPYHAKQKYLPQLINAWYKVALAEQVSDPKMKWLVKREIVRIVTPATLDLEWDDFSDSNNNSNILVSIIEEDNKFWISCLDITSNKWETWELLNYSLLKEELYKLSPKELILEKQLFSNLDIKKDLENIYSLNIYYFESKEYPRQKLLNHFWVNSLDWFGIEWSDLGIKASSQLLEYFENNQKSKLDFLSSISYINFKNYMNLDESTIKNLDLIYNYWIKSSNQWTLFWILNNSKTPAWSRLLREQIIKPLQSKIDINKRLDFIWEFIDNKILLDKVRDKLKFVWNIDAILNRLSLNRANPRDLLNLKTSLQSILDIFEIIKIDWSEKLKKIIF